MSRTWVYQCFENYCRRQEWGGDWKKKSVRFERSGSVEVNLPSCMVRIKCSLKSVQRSKGCFLFFWHPQLECSRTWFRVELSQLFPWLLQQRRKFMGIPWQYVLLLHRTGINCLQNDVLIRQRWVYRPSLFCHSGPTFSCQCSEMTIWSHVEWTVSSGVCSDCYLRKRRIVGFLIC